MVKLKLEEYGLAEMSRAEILKTEGGGICIFCVRGLLDGVKKNTSFNWGCCGRKKRKKN